MGKAFDTINKVAAELEYLMDWYEVPHVVQEAHDKLCEALRALRPATAPAVRPEGEPQP